MLNITEVFCHGEARQTYTHTRSGRFVHLTVNECGLADNPGFLHFAPKVITFTGTFTYAGEY